MKFGKRRKRLLALTEAFEVVEEARKELSLKALGDFIAFCLSPEVLNLSPQDIEEAGGPNRSYLWRIIKARQTPSIQVQAAIASILGVPAGFLTDILTGDTSLSEAKELYTTRHIFPYSNHSIPKQDVIVLPATLSEEEKNIISIMVNAVIEDRAKLRTRDIAKRIKAEQVTEAQRKRKPGRKNNSDGETK